jgi:hypothetical protein
MNTQDSQDVFVTEVEDRLETVQIASEIATSHCLDSEAK